MIKIFLTIGIIMGGAAGWLQYDYISGIEKEQVSASFLRLHPEASLASGDVFTEDHISSVSIPERFSSLASFAIPDTRDNRAWLIGKRASKDVTAGDLLQYDVFSQAPDSRFSSTIDVNMRAMTIPVNTSSAVAYFVEPGSTVDLIGTLQLDLTEDFSLPVPESIQKEVGEGVDTSLSQIVSRTVTKTILQNVKILAVGRATTRGSYLGVAEEGYRTVTIEVTPYQAEKLVFAMAHISNELVVLLRNPANKDMSELPVVNWKDLN